MKPAPIEPSRTERAVKLSFRPDPNYRGPTLPPHIPATFYVVMLATDIDRNGSIAHTEVLPTMYNSMAEARAAAAEFPTAVGILGLKAEVMRSEILV